MKHIETLGFVAGNWDSKWFETKLERSRDYKIATLNLEVLILRVWSFWDYSWTPEVGFLKQTAMIPYNSAMEWESEKRISRGSVFAYFSLIKQHFPIWLSYFI